MSQTKTEYRVTWKREGWPSKRKKFARKAMAERLLLLLGPEPWKAWGKNPDDLVCCTGFFGGDSCGCGGLTFREQSAEMRLNFPALEWVRLDSRRVEVSEWQETP